MTALGSRSRAMARVARLEAKSSAAQTMTIHEACDRWTDRYEAASAENADLIRRVIDRRNVLPMIWFGQPGEPRPSAGHLRFGLIYQAPDLLWPNEGLPPSPPLVPDSEAVAALFIEFTDSLVEHQIRQHDPYPREGFGIRELALREAARRRGGTATDAHLKCSTAVLNEKTPASTGVGEA